MITKQLHLSKWRMVLVFSSAPVIWNIIMGQIDGLMLAAYLPIPVLSVLLFLCKPQTNLGAAVTTIRRKPALIAIILFLAFSALIIWRWPFSIVDMHQITTFTFFQIPPLAAGGWNWSMWPWGLLFLPLLLRNQKQLGLAISPFLFPYAGLQSLIGPVLFAARWFPGWALIITWLLLWLRWAWMWHLF